MPICSGTTIAIIKNIIPIERKNNKLIRLLALIVTKDFKKQMLLKMLSLVGYHSVIKESYKKEKSF